MPGTLRMWLQRRPLGCVSTLSGGLTLQSLPEAPGVREGHWQAAAECGVPHARLHHGADECQTCLIILHGQMWFAAANQNFWPAADLGKMHGYASKRLITTVLPPSTWQ